MASAYRKIAQVARTVCQICDKENDVEWKCIQCEEVMCNDCKIAHLRMKVSRHHTVTTVRELMLSLPSQPIPKTTITKYCNQHTKEPLCMYCANCRVTICLDCFSSSHKKHEVDKISKVVEEKRQELSDILSESKSKLSTFKAGLQTLQKNRDDFSGELQSAVTTVKKQRDELRRQVDNTAQNFLDDLQNEDIDNKKHFKSVKKELESEVKRLEKFVSECENKISSQNDIAIVETVEETNTKAKIYKSCLMQPVTSPSRFVVGKIDKIDLREAFGHLQQQKSLISPVVLTPEPIRRAEVVKSFTSPVDVTTCIAAVDKNQAWMGRRWFGKQVALVSVDGEVKQKINLDFTLGDISVTPGGELLVTVGDGCGHHIKRLTPGGQFIIITDTSPFITNGLHVTPDNDVLVCLYKNNKQSNVTRMSITGQIKQQIQYDKHNKALYTDPQLVTQNVNQDVCVIDYTNTSVSVNTLVVVDKDGQLRFCYTGPTGMKLKNKFDCGGIVCDMSGCILLSDQNNHQIHQIDKDGRFIQFILTSQNGIYRPYGLSLHNNRQLWICNNDRKDVMVVKLQ